jgi:serine protease Do
MTASLRILCAFLAFTFSVARPVEAFTVSQMKEMEVKVKKLVAVNMPAVVSLIGEKVPGAGSGVVVTADGLILTAGHVTNGNDTMTVVFPDGKQAKCKVLGADYTRDVGLAKIIQPGKYPFAELGDSDKLETTTIVIALGHPGGYDVRRTPPARIGRISSKNAGGFLMSDCTLIGGDSGGPLFDLDGKVVGIHSSISESLSYNRDAPVNAAKVSWEKMLMGERWGKIPGQRPPPFGQRKTGGKAVLGAVFGTSGSGSTVLKEVQPKSPLEAAGVLAGDVILRIGGEEMASSEAVAGKIGKSRPGDRLALVYRRGSEEKRTEVVLISEAEMLKRIEPAAPQKP